MRERLECLRKIITKKTGLRIIKILCSVFLIALVFTNVIIPVLTTPPKVPDYIAKYLKDGENVVHVEEISFRNQPEYNMTAYILSSGKVILYSENLRKVVLGDEWVGVQDGDRVALELYSAYYFFSIKKINKTELIKDINKDDIMIFIKGVDIFNSYAKSRLVDLGVVTILTGALLLLLFPPSGMVGLTLFLISYTAKAASIVHDFLNNLNLGLEQFPQVYFTLAVLKPDKEAYAAFNMALEKLGDKDAERALKNISNTLNVITGAHELAGKSLIILSVLASKNQVLTPVVEAVGRDGVVKLFEFFITSDYARAQDLLEKLEKWSTAATTQEKLSAVQGIEQHVWEAALQTIVSEAAWFLTHYFSVKPLENRDKLAGFYGVHCLLLADLGQGLDSHSDSIERGFYAPSIGNLLEFYAYKALYHDLERELYEGLLKSSVEDAYSIGIVSNHMCVPCITGDVTDKATILAKISGSWKQFTETRYNNSKSKLKRTVETAFILYKEAMDAYNAFREDMASRRKTPGPVSGLRVVLVMDVSGSMNDEFRGERKIDAAIRSAKDFVRLVSPLDKVAIVKFSTSASVVADFTGDKGSLIQALGTLSPGGRTALGDGLWLALDLIEQGPREGAAAVILLTDGMHNAGTHTPLESAKRARALKVPVYTLGFGEKVDLDENVLANVASVTGGVYVYAPSPEDLRRIYTQLSGYISGHLAVQSLLQTLRQGEELSMTVPVERGQSYFSVRASYTGSSLSITAISPSGRVLNLRSSNVVYYREKGVEQLTVYYPESGEWKVLVKAVEAPSQGIDLAVSVLRPGFTARLRDEVLTIVPGGG
ncbi:vWA domain-containing protein, partial [Infirmifilum sp.]|uniref:vWA domain-containing protein n=1 Tax=Infirmifilum sp. TaxID=2856575 RepID=UPI003D137B0C